MRIACTGFVTPHAGSTSSANVLLLRALLEQNYEIDFFSKPTFVDPRPIVSNLPGFRFVPVVNYISDGVRCKVEKIPALSALGRYWDSSCYNRLLVKRIRKAHRQKKYDLCLWLGDYAHGTLRGVPTVSFVQGPPGTDARSLFIRQAEIQELTGSLQILKWKSLSRFRLSRFGLPNFNHTDHFIVGSHQSCRILNQVYDIHPSRISILPYPVDLPFFKLKNEDSNSSTNAPLRVLWLGRIVPRKRLDVFLNGARLAIQQGVDIQLTIVGKVGFLQGYEKLIQHFPFPERLKWIQSLPQSAVPTLLQRHDLLAQPSDEENFGSSVAEAQTCGLPVIVGVTNGNADYLCSRDIHLVENHPEQMCAALKEMSKRKQNGDWGDAIESRKFAERQFHIRPIVQRLSNILESTVARTSLRSSSFSWVKRRI